MPAAWAPDCSTRPTSGLSWSSSAATRVDTGASLSRPPSGSSPAVAHVAAPGSRPGRRAPAATPPVPPPRPGGRRRTGPGWPGRGRPGAAPGAASTVLATRLSSGAAGFGHRHVDAVQRLEAADPVRGHRRPGDVELPAGEQLLHRPHVGHHQHLDRRRLGLAAPPGVVAFQHHRQARRDGPEPERPARQVGPRLPLGPQVPSRPAGGPAGRSRPRRRAAASRGTGPSKRNVTDGPCALHGGEAVVARPGAGPGVAPHRVQGEAEVVGGDRRCRRTSGRPDGARTWPTTRPAPPAPTRRRRASPRPARPGRPGTAAAAPARAPPPRPPCGTSGRTGRGWPAPRARRAVRVPFGRPVRPGRAAAVDDVDRPASAVLRRPRGSRPRSRTRRPPGPRRRPGRRPGAARAGRSLRLGRHRHAGPVERADRVELEALHP